MATLTISITAPHVSDSFEFEATEANIRHNMEAVERTAETVGLDPMLFAHGKLNELATRTPGTELSHADTILLLYFVLTQEIEDGEPVHAIAAYRDIEAHIKLRNGKAHIKLSAEAGLGPTLN